jgi:hypothetical protein
MAYKVPVGGVFATIYYDFETGFQVYGNSTYGSPGLNSEYYLGINKMLGHAVKITGWSENNNVTLLRGLNNIEAANAIDGKFTGELKLEFAAVGTLDWMEALMGLKSDSVDYGNKVYEYTKAGVPKSMTFVIMIQNDSVNPHGGDVFVLKGVIMQNVQIAINGTDAPVTVTMTCPYASESAYSSEDLPDFYYPSDNAFNFGQAVAYFWDPMTSADPGDPASFDTFETVCEELTMTIDHGAELIYGIGSRKARDKFHKFLEYTVSVKVYYRDKERFLQKFYGCSEGPINDTVPAFKRIKIVIQNCKTCDDRYRRMEFEFETAKLNTRESTLDIDSAITETYEFKPLHATIRAWNGEEPVPQWAVSPLHVKQGDLVAMHAKFLPKGAPAQIFIGTEMIAAVDVNCSGELEYRVMADPQYDYWSIGNHTICVKAYDGETLIQECQDVFVTAEDVTSIPRIIVCPQLFNQVTTGPYANEYGPINVKGYNFGTYGETTSAELSIYCALGDTFETKGTLKYGPIDIMGYISGTLGSFDYDTGSVTLTEAGVYIVEVDQRLSNGVGGTEQHYIIHDNLYIAIVGLTDSDVLVRTITGTGLKPNERTMLYVTLPEGSGTVLRYMGVGMTDDYGLITFTNVTVPAGTRLTELVQDVILADGSGQLVARADIVYP